jgi:hypothetical protein
MLTAICRCRLQLWHPLVDDDNAHVEDEHPLHPLQGGSLAEHANDVVACMLLLMMWHFFYDLSLLLAPLLLPLAILAQLLRLHSTILAQLLPLNIPHRR